MFRRVLHAMVLTAGILSGSPAAVAENRIALEYLARHHLRLDPHEFVLGHAVIGDAGDFGA